MQSQKFLNIRSKMLEIVPKNVSVMSSAFFWYANYYFTTNYKKGVRIIFTLQAKKIDNNFGLRFKENLQMSLH